METCCVCLEKRPDVFGHEDGETHWLCNECLSKLPEKAKLCPLCRKELGFHGPFKQARFPPLRDRRRNRIIANITQVMGPNHTIMIRTSAEIFGQPTTFFAHSMEEMLDMVNTLQDYISDSDGEPA